MSVQQLAGAVMVSLALWALLIAVAVAVLSGAVQWIGFVLVLWAAIGFGIYRAEVRRWF